MSWFTNLRTSTKLLLFFLFMASGVALLGGVGIAGIQEMKERQAETYSVDVQSIAILQRLAIERFRVARSVRDAIIERDAAKVEALTRDIDRQEAALRATIAEAERTVVDPGARTVVLRMRDELGTAFSLGRTAIGATPRPGAPGDPALLARSLAECSKYVDGFDRAVDAEVQRLKEQANRRAAHSQGDYETQVTFGSG